MWDLGGGLCFWGDVCSDLKSGGRLQETDVTYLEVSPVAVTSGSFLNASKASHYQINTSLSLSPLIHKHTYTPSLYQCMRTLISLWRLIVQQHLNVNGFVR